MGLVGLESGKLYHTRRCAKDSIRADCVVHVLLGDAHGLVSLGLGDDSALDLNLVLTVGRRLVANT